LSRLRKALVGTAQGDGERGAGFRLEGHESMMGLPGLWLIILRTGKEVSISCLID
jgi:hypothetical protein